MPRLKAVSAPRPQTSTAAAATISSGRASEIRLPPVTQETTTNGLVAAAAPRNCQAVSATPSPAGPADRRDQTTYAALLSTAATTGTFPSTWLPVGSGVDDLTASRETRTVPPSPRASAAPPVRP